jgi:hypothetical protein
MDSLITAAARALAAGARNRKFESISLQRGVRCELDLGEGGFADEIAAAPPGGFTCWRTRPLSP